MIYLPALWKHGAGLSYMKTSYMLLAQYECAAIPMDKVVQDYFAPLTSENFVRKCTSGEIRLPIMRLGTSQKSSKVIHIEDLAQYLDERRDAARKELDLVTD